MKQFLSSGMALAFSVLVAMSPAVAPAQEESVKPGINDAFKDPDAKEFVRRFEVESREVFAQRKAIVAACGVKPGMTVADVGAGTGLFTLLFAEAVGEKGREGARRGGCTRLISPRSLSRTSRRRRGRRAIRM